MVAAVIVAAGRGKRSGRTDKVLQTLSGRTVLERSVMPFLKDSRIAQIVIVAPPGREAEFLEAAFPGGTPAAIAVRAVAGGERRQDSVAEGLKALHPDVTLVAVHDAARPLHRLEVLVHLIDTALDRGAAVPVVPVTDTLAPVDVAAGTLGGAIDRSLLRHVQTPQVFRRDWLVQAHDRARTDRVEATDDASLVLRLRHPVAYVAGTSDNLKITTALDLKIAETLLKETSA
jgi:2-C-methyl-D-erythritol 4-phosphate cytidylyltransferase